MNQTPKQRALEVFEGQAGRLRTYGDLDIAVRALRERKIHVRLDART